MLYVQSLFVGKEQRLVDAGGQPGWLGTIKAVGNDNTAVVPVYN